MLRIAIVGIVISMVLSVSGCGHIGSLTTDDLSANEIIALRAAANYPVFFGVPIGAIGSELDVKYAGDDPYSGGTAYNKAVSGRGLEDSFVRVITNEDDEVVFIRLTASYMHPAVVHDAYAAMIDVFSNDYPKIRHRGPGYHSANFVSSKKYIEERKKFNPFRSNSFVQSEINDYLSSIDIINGLEMGDGYNIVVVEIRTREYDGMVKAQGNLGRFEVDRSKIPLF